MTQSNEPTIHILFFDGCPNHEPAVELVETVVRELHIDALVEEVELLDPEDAQRFSFLGSPTIQINGVDIEPAARERTDFAFACRTYDGGAGIPDRGLLEASLQEYVGAGRNDSRCANVAAQARFGAASGISSALTAILASACCWAPLVLIGLGVSSAGVSSILWKWRPWLLATALSLLAAGFAWTIWRGRHCCSKRERSALRLNRAVLWASVVLVTLSVFAPNIIDRVLVRSIGVSILPVIAESNAIHLKIEGMHCATCAVSVQSALSKVDGVDRARVDYNASTALIEHTGGVVASDVIEAVEREGYSARAATGVDSNKNEWPADQGDSQ